MTKFELPPIKLIDKIIENMAFKDGQFNEQKNIFDFEKHLIGYVAGFDFNNKIRIAISNDEDLKQMDFENEDDYLERLNYYENLAKLTKTRFMAYLSKHGVYGKNLEKHNHFINLVERLKELEDIIKCPNCGFNYKFRN